MKIQLKKIRQWLGIALVGSSLALSMAVGSAVLPSAQEASAGAQCSNHGWHTEWHTLQPHKDFWDFYSQWNYNGNHYHKFYNSTDYTFHTKACYYWASH